ncbi:MAG: recombinase family protein [Pseudonocardiaceae bacterium]
MTTPALHAVPQVQPRAVALIRVSKERDGMVSPEVQQLAISSYAQSRSYHVVEWLEGLDESGSRVKSRWWAKLDEGIGWVEDGRAEILLVWKFSRTARHRLKWAVALDRVETAGGRLESATEQVDAATSTGRFTRGMLAELNAFEAERIGETWKEVHASRVGNGLPATGKPKWGYVYDQAAKMHRPDPETGAVLASLYQSYIAGTSVYALVQWLNREGHRTTAGGWWSDRTLRRVLDSGFGAGFIPTAAGLLPARDKAGSRTHEPVIDEDTWQAYLDSRATRRARPARTERSRYVLSGMVVHSCGHRMTAGLFGHARVPKFRCAWGRATAGTDCPGGYVTTNVLEAAVLDWLAEHADDVEAAEAVAEAQVAQASASEAADKRRLTEITRLERALVRLAQQHAEDEDPDEDTYQAARADYLARKKQLAAAVEENGRRRRMTDMDPRRVARSLLADWKVMPVEARRELLHQIIDHVEVSTGRPRSRVRVVPVWELGCE